MSFSAGGNRHILELAAHLVDLCALRLSLLLQESCSRLDLCYLLFDRWLLLGGWCSFGRNDLGRINPLRLLCHLLRHVYLRSERTRRILRHFTLTVVERAIVGYLCNWLCLFGLIFQCSSILIGR